MARERRRESHDRGARAPMPRAAMAGWILAALIVAAGVFLRVTSPPVREYTPDEQTYATFAAGFADIGFGRYAEVVANFARDPDLTHFPPPTRVGYLWLAVAAMEISGDRTVKALAGMSLLASIVLLVAIVYAAGRLLGPWAAAIAALLLAASPLDLAIARRAWQDDVFAIFGAGMAAMLAWRAARAVPREQVPAAAHAGGKRPKAAASRPARRASTAPAALIFFALAGYALLIKEAALPLLGLGTGLLAWWSWREGGFAKAWPILAGCALTIAAVTGLLAQMCGGFDVLVRTWTGLIRGQDTNDYVLKYQTGGPLYYVQGLVILQPGAAAIGALGILVALVRPQWIVSESPAKRRAIFALAAWSAGFVLFTAFWPLKSLRFLSPLFGPAVILGAAAIVAAVRELSTRVSPAAARGAAAAVGVALAYAAWRDLARFQEFFVRRGIPDLATPWFTGGR